MHCPSSLSLSSSTRRRRRRLLFRLLAVVVLLLLVLLSDHLSHQEQPRPHSSLVLLWVEAFVVSPQPQFQPQHRHRHRRGGTGGGGSRIVSRRDRRDHRSSGTTRTTAATTTTTATTTSFSWRLFDQPPSLSGGDGGGTTTTDNVGDDNDDDTTATSAAERAETIAGTLRRDLQSAEQRRARLSRDLGLYQDQLRRAQSELGRLDGISAQNQRNLDGYERNIQTARAKLFEFTTKSQEARRQLSSMQDEVVLLPPLSTNEGSGGRAVATTASLLDQPGLLLPGVAVVALTVLAAARGWLQQRPTSEFDDERTATGRRDRDRAPPMSQNGRSSNGRLLSKKNDINQYNAVDDSTTGGGGGVAVRVVSFDRFHPLSLFVVVLVVLVTTGLTTSLPFLVVVFRPSCSSFFSSRCYWPWWRRDLFGWPWGDRWACYR
jgi:hypothetical protein